MPSDGREKPSGPSDSTELQEQPNAVSEAQERWEDAFVHCGFQVIPTSSDSFYCGFFAVIESIKAKHPDVTPPTIEELKDSYKSKPIQDIFRAGLEIGEDLNHDTFSGDQLAALIAHWGSLRGLQINLGYIKKRSKPVQGQSEYEDPVLFEGQWGEFRKSIDVWIENNGIEGMAAHWSGLKDG